MVRLASYADRAAGRSPAATATSPTLSWLTDRSRCQPALPGSAPVRRRYSCSRACQQGQVSKAVDVGLQPAQARTGRFILAIQGE